MVQIVTFDGDGNIVEVREIEDQFSNETPNDTQAIAEALSNLPTETLNALKQALGINS
jgi:predicted Fe-Mo cluster-binding NifX family protein